MFLKSVQRGDSMTSSMIYTLYLAEPVDIEPLHEARMLTLLLDAMVQNTLTAPLRIVQLHCAGISVLI